MQTEKDFTRALRRHLSPSLFIQSLETAGVPGLPDLYAEGVDIAPCWIECKIIDSPGRIIPLDYDQIRWLRENEYAGGISLIAVFVRNWRYPMSSDTRNYGPAIAFASGADLIKPVSITYLWSRQRYFRANKPILQTNNLNFWPQVYFELVKGIHSTMNFPKNHPITVPDFFRNAQYCLKGWKDLLKRQEELKSPGPTIKSGQGLKSPR